MIYKVGLMGATGRMGLEIASLISTGFAEGGHALELSDAVSQSGALTSVEGTPVRSVDEPAREPVHVWIDFSRPAGTLALLERVQAPVVIGTTGFTEEQVARIEAYARRSPVMLCPNTSPGMGALTRMLKAGYLPPSLGFAAVLEEEHHKNKKDSPSGTAKALLSVLEQAGYRDIQVHVTRAGSTVGTHTVRFVADGEELSFQHRVVDRSVFARGACLAALFLAQQTQPRIYRMEDIAG